MPRIEYRKYKPTMEGRRLIDTANVILAEYDDQGFRLTLRQLYYQFVARDLLPNTNASYSRLGVIVSRAREAGMVDWDHLEDRGRSVVSFTHWESPSELVELYAKHYHRDLWATQPVRVEVWVEKQALEDVVGSAAREWDVPYFSCKGYVSTSAMWDAAHNRFLKSKLDHVQDTIIIHLGDHDPSGVQMTEDIERRVRIFSQDYDGGDHPTIEVRRIALNLGQVDEYNPPPNPAKTTDSRYQAYVDECDVTDSWELDALEPSIIAELICNEIQDIVVSKLMAVEKHRQREERRQLKLVTSRWGQIQDWLKA